MSIFGCENKFDCVGLALLASIVIGVITAFLRITGVITVGAAFLWVTLGVAIAYLAVFLIATAIRGGQGVLCAAATTVLLSALATALVATVLLAISFATTSVVGAIITGALLTFFSLLLSGTACLIRCWLLGR